MTQLTQSGTSSSNHGAGSESRQRNTQNHTSDNHAHHGEYTKEQLAAVKKIKACKTYYEILGVAKYVLYYILCKYVLVKCRSCIYQSYIQYILLNRNASDADIKKAYRKLALQFHPGQLIYYIYLGWVKGAICGNLTRRCLVCDLIDKNKAPGADEAFKAIGKVS